MPYGYLGQNTPNQTVSNSGVFSISDVASLEKQGKFGGSLELIAEETITTSVASVDLTESLGTFNTSYDVHLLTWSGIAPVVDNTRLQMRFYESGVLETASVYQYAVQYGYATGSFGDTNRSTATDRLWLNYDLGTASNEVGNGYTYLYNLSNSSKYSFHTLQVVTVNSASVFSFRFGGGVLPQASLVNGINIFGSAGNLNGGTIKLYGVKQL